MIEKHLGQTGISLDKRNYSLVEVLDLLLYVKLRRCFERTLAVWDTRNFSVISVSYKLQK